MIKKTLYFGNPCYLSKKLDQMLIEFPEADKEARTIPIEDIGIVLLDHQQITLSQGLLVALLGNNAAVISCDHTHLPLGMFLHLNGHSTQTENWRCQQDASMPLKKNLWQQTIQAKLTNQAAVLQLCGIDANNLLHWARHTRSGDPDNYEARGASFYWKHLFDPEKNFGGRHRYGDPPNNLLNYGYAILRGLMARALVSSGMLPSLGIHHRNKYNAYCLADDIMEPFRPYVDLLVLDIVGQHEVPEELTPELKRKLLELPGLDVVIDGKSSPLMVGVHRTSASLMKCFEGVLRKIQYPEIPLSAGTA